MKKSLPKIKSIINKSEIARRMNVTPQYVGQLLNGKKHTAARIKEIEKIVRDEFKNFKRDKNN